MSDTSDMFSLVHTSNFSKVDFLLAELQIILEPCFSGKAANPPIRYLDEFGNFSNDFYKIHDGIYILLNIIG